jgi:glycosyltransferase involved in cell wall biosynthesis
VKFQLPPPLIRTSRKASALYSRFRWPSLIPGPAQSLYCISAGRSQLLLHRLKPSGAVSVNHEIVEPPGMKSPAGRCAGTLDVTVANSRKVAEQMKACWPKKPIRAIPFLTSNASMPRPLHRRQVGPRDLLRVVYLGRLVEQKRPDCLVKRWPVLSALPELAPARLDVHGYDPTGKMLKELKAFTAHSGCCDKIAVHGEYSLSQLPEILENADLVVLPSLWEGLPLVLVEAMLRGVPFVATAAGGTEELGDSNPNVLVTSTNWEEFENGILQMAGRIRSGQIDPLELHHFAEARYGYDAVSRQWLDCLLAPRTFFNLHV